MPTSVSPSPHIEYLVLPNLDQQIALLRKLFPCAHLPPDPPEVSRGMYVGGYGRIYRPKMRVWRELLPEAFEKMHGLPYHGNVFMSVAQHLSWREDVCVENYCEESATRLRLHQSTQLAFNRVERNGSVRDFDLLNVDVSALHAGKSATMVKELVTQGNEKTVHNLFPLDPLTILFAVWMTKQVMPENEAVHHINCPGAEYDPLGAGKWADTPRLEVSRHTVAIDWNWDKRARASVVNAVGSFVRTKS